MQLPLNFDKHTGDLDEMVKRKNIRALVMLNPVAFFYDQGQPHGVMYETMEDFQRFANQKLKLGNPGLKVTFLPVAPAQAEAGPDLRHGRRDRQWHRHHSRARKAGFLFYSDSDRG